MRCVNNDDQVVQVKGKIKQKNKVFLLFLASEDRTSMVTYWKRNSNPNLESMMLDTNADKINRFEYPEILECLPDLDGKRILELGAGIGYVFKIEKKSKYASCLFLDDLQKHLLN
jgi:hypothetical protein